MKSASSFPMKIALLSLVVAGTGQAAGYGVQSLMLVLQTILLWYVLFRWEAGGDR